MTRRRLVAVVCNRHEFKPVATGTGVRSGQRSGRGLGICFLEAADVIEARLAV